MRRDLSVAVLLGLVVGAALAAPAPRPPSGPRTTRPLDLVEGLYQLSWSGQSYWIALGSDSRYGYVGTCSTWKGVWKWDRQSRRLIMLETADGGFSYMHWEGELGPSLAGTFRLGDRDILVKFTKAKKGPPPGHLDGAEEVVD